MALGIIDICNFGMGSGNQVFSGISRHLELDGILRTSIGSKYWVLDKGQWVEANPDTV